MRLLNVTGLDPTSVGIVASVSGNPHTDNGNHLSPLAGAAEPNRFVGLSDRFVQTGAGNDVVSAASGGQVVADLGSGDDSFVSTGAAHVVFGGADDDSYVLNVPLGGHTMPLSAARGQAHFSFDGGAGNDTVFIRDDDIRSNLAASDAAS